MKRQIYELLQNSPKYRSGPQMSAALGISRVAVWKHIQQMRRCGVQIESSPQGYRLVQSSDTPWPWSVGRWGERVRYFPELASTMTEALTLAREGCPTLSVVLAGRQTRGRGRLDRQWCSAEGGLYFTMVLRPLIAPSAAARLHLAAALDVAALLSENYGLEAGVKWPNDVLVAGRKIAGILAQMEAEPDRIAFVNIGIGINVNNQPPDQPPAVSIAQLLGRRVARSTLLVDFLERFEKRLTAGFSAEVATQWRRLSVTIGQTVSIQTINETITGQALDIDDDGALLLQTADGAVRSVVHGDCFHHPGFAEAAP